RTLGHVQPPLQGIILLNQVPLERHSSIELASAISVVLTEAIASKNLTVLELVSLGRQPYTNWIGTLREEDLLKIRSALEMVDLTGLQDKKCYELSDGQLQKVMIARALAQDTSIILMDEPTSDRKSTRLNSSHVKISYAVFCLKKKKRREAQAGVC